MLVDAHLAQLSTYGQTSGVKARQNRRSGDSTSALSTAHQRQLNKLLMLNVPTPLQKHLERMLTGTQVVTNNRPITPYITATGLCVVPAMDISNAGLKAGVKEAAGLGWHNSRPLRTGNDIVGKSEVQNKGPVAVPACKPHREPHPAAIAPDRSRQPIQVGSSLELEACRQAQAHSPACCVKRRMRGSKRKCRSSWHSLSEVSNMVMEMAGVNDDWLRNDLLPYADRVYG